MTTHIAGRNVPIPTLTAWSIFAALARHQRAVSLAERRPCARHIANAKDTARQAEALRTWAQEEARRSVFA